MLVTTLRNICFSKSCFLARMVFFKQKKKTTVAQVIGSELRKVQSSWSQNFVICVLPRSFSLIGTLCWLFLHFLASRSSEWAKKKSREGGYTRYTVRYIVGLISFSSATVLGMLFDFAMRRASLLLALFIYCTFSLHLIFSLISHLFFVWRTLRKFWLPSGKWKRGEWKNGKWENEGENQQKK